MFYQLTKPRIRLLDARWRPELQRFCGPVPPGLGISHMIAESNGEETPRTKNLSRNPVGLMQISQSDGLRYGYQLDQLVIPRINIYVWCRKTNNDSLWLHTTYPGYWGQPDYDFWLIVRLLFIVGQNVLDQLLTNSSDAGNKTQNVLNWLQNTTIRYGTHTPRDLKQIANHLLEIKKTLCFLHGPHYISTAYSQTPLKNPGTEITVLNATVQKDT